MERDLAIVETVKLLNALLGPSRAASWFETPNPYLEGALPVALLIQGLHGRVLEVLRAQVLDSSNLDDDMDWSEFYY